MGPEAVQGFPDQVLRSLSLHNYSWHSHLKFADPGVLHELATAHPQSGPVGCSLWSHLSDAVDGGTGHGVTHIQRVPHASPMCAQQGPAMGTSQFPSTQ